ncbi:hypothetical protein [Streptomyces sp. NPDC096030]|uniref:hypothetical protein n=1 Tax=Streptomyces sp. NPDC096030 TaxID=3155423 RepID=UPI003333E50F
MADALARTDAEAAAVGDPDGDADADRGASDEDGAGPPVPSASPSPEGSAWISDGIPGLPSSPVGAPPVWPDRNAPETTATSSPTPTTPAPASSRRGPGARRFVA